MNLQAELIKVSKSMQWKILTFVFKILCCLLLDSFISDLRKLSDFNMELKKTPMQIALLKVSKSMQQKSWLLENLVLLTFIHIWIDLQNLSDFNMKLETTLMKAELLKVSKSMQ